MTIVPGVSLHAEGSAQVEFGNTKLFVTCSVEEKQPPHLMNTAEGWITAEYGMLPRATNTRSAREAARGKQSGRTLEIQRLIGRSMRAVVDCSVLGPRTFTLDCDVLQADGGTRTGDHRQLRGPGDCLKGGECEARRTTSGAHPRCRCLDRHRPR